jgi:hypothetical protein
MKGCSMSQQLAPEPTAVCAANLFASPNRSGETILIGGLMPNETEWVQTLTCRAARALWFELTKLLFPDKSDEVIGHVATMRSLPPFQAEVTTVTTWTFVSEREGGGVLVSGWMGKPGWSLHLSAFEVYRFWAALDSALFPAGWSVKRQD